MGRTRRRCPCYRRPGDDFGAGAGRGGMAEILRRVRRSGCSSPAWSTSSARRSASPRSSCSRQAGCDVEVPRGADLLRPAGLQFRRPRAMPRAIARAGDRRLRGLRLCRGAVRLLRRDDQAALSRACSPATATGARGPQRLAAKVHELVSFLVDVRGMTDGRRRLRRHASPTTIPARGCASSASATQPRAAARIGRRAEARRAARTPTSAAASAAPSASSIPTSPTPSSRRRPRRSRPPAPARCSPAISAA